MDQAFNGIIDDNGNIYKVEYGQRTVIGVSAEIFTNLKSNAEKALNRNEELAQEKDKYYNMLVEHGIIQKPKSAEDRITELENSNKNILLTNEKILSALENINLTLNKNQKRLEVLEDELTKSNSNGNVNGNRSGQDKSGSKVNG